INKNFVPIDTKRILEREKNVLERKSFERSTGRALERWFVVDFRS
ncbi:unnamed protein product, partial [Arabidopsis halleri]